MRVSPSKGKESDGRMFCGLYSCEMSVSPCIKRLHLNAIGGAYRQAKLTTRALGQICLGQAAFAHRRSFATYENAPGPLA